MARTRSMTSIDAEISKVENELSKLQEKQDALIVLSGKLNDVPSGRLFRADLGSLQIG